MGKKVSRLCRRGLAARAARPPTSRSGRSRCANSHSRAIAARPPIGDADVASVPVLIAPTVVRGLFLGCGGGLLGLLGRRRGRGIGGCGLRRLGRVGLPASGRGGSLVRAEQRGGGATERNGSDRRTIAHADHARLTRLLPGALAVARSHDVAEAGRPVCRGLCAGGGTRPARDDGDRREAHRQGCLCGGTRIGGRDRRRAVGVGVTTRGHHADGNSPHRDSGNREPQPAPQAWRRTEKSELGVQVLGHGRGYSLTASAPIPSTFFEDH